LRRDVTVKQSIFLTAILGGRCVTGVSLHRQRCFHFSVLIRAGNCRSIRLSFGNTQLKDVRIYQRQGSRIDIAAAAKV
jgi:hypothetical protein